MVRVKKPETAVLLHGMILTSAFMGEIESHLKKEGYNVLNVDYPSTKHKTGDLADLVAKEIKEHMGARRPRLHFIGHSMGGTVAHELLQRHEPKNAETLVMLGSPNGGSAWADFMKSNILSNTLYQLIFGPAGQQLSTDREIPSAPMRAKVGVIAGSRPFLPLATDWVMGQGPHDGLVSVDRVRFPDAEHIVVPTDHFGMLVNRQVKELILRKIRHGTFESVVPEPA